MMLVAEYMKGHRSVSNYDHRRRRPDYMDRWRLARVYVLVFSNVDESTIDEDELEPARTDVHVWCDESRVATIWAGRLMKIRGDV